MGMDETLIGTIFMYPVSQADSQWLEELLEDGVLTFGVVEGPMQSGVRSIKEFPEGVRVAAPEGRVLPTSRHILNPPADILEIDFQEVMSLWNNASSTNSFLTPHHGPFPPSVTEVEIASQIDWLSLEDSNPSTHIPSVPINDSVNDAEDLYAKFWDQSSEGLPYDDNSDISSYDSPPSDTVVKSVIVNGHPTAIIVTSHAFLLVPINHMALYLPHTIFLILILSPVIPLILILIPIPIPIPILILVLISIHVPIPVPIPVPVPVPIPIPVPVPVPILILVPMPILPSQILVFPPIATILPVPILVPVLDLAPLPITLIVPGFPTILLSSILPSMMLHVPLLLLQLQAYNPASQYQLVPGHFQTL
ncbi:hypothetical protein BS47DRAFT_1394719 [Hydnum rufescens UP504]|uniref:Uncharacterized protein n=1 Tax=Hydnum rufescens UP504 TaxID=1448309 RepID=A0A9P6DUQ2_9AGAM|nr:hypothetical protein BS47DRAFT_1394719 [Hydnum rufescens UP504]